MSRKDMNRGFIGTLGICVWCLVFGVWYLVFCVWCLVFDAFVRSLKMSLGVIPAEAEIQYFQEFLDACLRRHDGVLGFLRDRRC
jgi:hypothetical protein